MLAVEGLMFKPFWRSRVFRLDPKMRQRKDLTLVNSGDFLCKCYSSLGLSPPLCDAPTTASRIPYEMSASVFTSTSLSVRAKAGTSLLLSNLRRVGVVSQDTQARGVASGEATPAWVSWEAASHVPHKPSM